MAVFTIGERTPNPHIKESTLKYPYPKDLINLIHYCCDKSRYTVFCNLYPLGVDGLINQMLYLQNFTGKVFSTRAIHYIMSIEYDELSQGKKFEQMKQIVNHINAFYFSNYQHLVCLHSDKDGRYDIHIIINPINIQTYNKYHCSPSDFKSMIDEIAVDLYLNHQIAIQSYSYITETGRMRFGNETYIYQNK
ncbi:relaxase/mobilization nuclease domain-containing protein [Faecalicatena contorta]|uniref:relaxase/mobilization nuclease domain-containing protein n=1 Tax=Faecalicatena contorta TaxID=39482 RepID=UPI001F1A65FA|nr:relaxase/mobilization nuclease domain-containing protein [Faecalicatena contorta]MCF2554357.1 relaxase/mobilization nuclease domain-containing protein [Faecalicatena contorta]